MKLKFNFLRKSNQLAALKLKKALNSEKFITMYFFSRKHSVEGHPSLNSEESCQMSDDAEVPPQFSWIVEECILAAYDKKTVSCPTHGDIPLAQIAPDTVSLTSSEI